MNSPERAKPRPADETRSAQPVEWAFVVHLRPGVVPEAGRVAGRVEHVVSGRSERFGSLPELLAFFGRVLRTVREDIEQSGESPPGR